jgi:YggT family protein
MSIVINIIDIIKEILTLLVIAHVVLSYILDYYHPVRQWVDRIVEPMLMPIRRRVPLVGMFDISPILLIFLIRILFNLIINLLR